MEKHVTPYGKEIFLHKWSMIHVFKEVVLSLYQNNAADLEFTKEELLPIIMENLNTSIVFRTSWNRKGEPMDICKTYFFECRASVFLDQVFKNGNERKSLENIYVISTLLKYLPSY